MYSFTKRLYPIAMLLDIKGFPILNKWWRHARVKSGKFFCAPLCCYYFDRLINHSAYSVWGLEAVLPNLAEGHPLLEAHLHNIVVVVVTHVHQLLRTAPVHLADFYRIILLALTPKLC